MKEDKLGNLSMDFSVDIINLVKILKRENGKINPNSPLTRAQTAQILMSLLEYRGKLNH